MLTFKNKRKSLLIFNYTIKLRNNVNLKRKTLNQKPEYELIKI